MKNILLTLLIMKLALHVRLRRYVLPEVLRTRIGRTINTKVLPWSEFHAVVELWTAGLLNTLYTFEDTSGTFVTLCENVYVYSTRTVQYV